MGRSTFRVSNGVAEVKCSLLEVFMITDFQAQNGFLLPTQPAVRGALASGKGLHSSVCIIVVCCLFALDLVPNGNIRARGA